MSHGTSRCESLVMGMANRGVCVWCAVAKKTVEWNAVWQPKTHLITYIIYAILDCPNIEPKPETKASSSLRGTRSIL